MQKRSGNYNLNWKSTKCEYTIEINIRNWKFLERVLKNHWAIVWLYSSGKIIYKKEEPIWNITLWNLRQPFFCKIIIQFYSALVSITFYFCSSMILFSHQMRPFVCLNLYILMHLPFRIKSWLYQQWRKLVRVTEVLQ